MASLIGTVGALGSSLLGDLISKGVQTLGNVASQKIQSWEKKQTNVDQTSQQTKSIFKQISKNQQQIRQVDDRLKKVEAQMEIE